MQKERFYNLFGITEKLDEQSEMELQNVIREYPYFQMAQLMYLKYLKEILAPTFEIELKKVAVRVPNRKQLFNYLNSKPVRKKVLPNINFRENIIPSFKLEYEGDFNQGNSLIDKFLSSNKGIITPKDSDSNHKQWVENEALKKSEEENDEIVTETLAMIYFQQNKYEKALNAFRKLSLKYPEKSVYFATQIKEIEKLKNI